MPLADELLMGVPRMWSFSRSLRSRETVTCRSLPTDSAAHRPRAARSDARWNHPVAGRPTRWRAALAACHSMGSAWPSAKTSSGPRILNSICLALTPIEIRQRLPGVGSGDAAIRICGYAVGLASESPGCVATGVIVVSAVAGTDITVWGGDADVDIPLRRQHVVAVSDSAFRVSEPVVLD